MATGFTYDNFSSGRWGGIIGTKFGKTWNRLTASVYGEYLQIFGNHNNKIDVSSIPPFAAAGVDEIAVDLKSTKELLAGINALYQLSDRWSFGGGFKFIEHTDNGVKSIHTDLPAALNPLANALVAQTKNMKDGWDEYYLTAVLAHQVTDSVQLALYAEYVFDDSHSNSQNGTDAKAEIGVRANARF